MSKYERFIIYPLLFVALFYGLTGGQPFVTAGDIRERIVAREIVVVNDAGKEVVNLETYKPSITPGDEPGEVEGEGRVIINDSDGTKKSTLIADSLTLTSKKLTGSYCSGSISMFYRDDLSNAFNLIVFPEKPELPTGTSLRIYNEHGDKRVVLGQTAKDGHGGVFVYDKYGEDYRGYGPW